MNRIIKCFSILFVGAIMGLAVNNQVMAKEISDRDFIKAQGVSLRDNYGTGKRVLLRGVNVGGWFVQELWMCPTKESKNVKEQKTIESTLINRFGVEKAKELLNIYYDNFWTEQDFNNCEEMGMNCLRLPLWYKTIVDDNNQIKKDAFDRIDWFVKEAGKRGIYVILDMHGAPGSQNDKDHSGDISSNKSLWQGADAAKNQNLYVEIWKNIAKHYAGNPTVAGYDLLNEPYCIKGEYTDSTVWDLYDKAYKAIREVDENHVIIMEGTWEAYNLPDPTKYGWTNVMYEYHSYNYNNQTDPNEQLKTIKNKINMINMMDYDVPSYIGETSFFSNTQSWEKCLSELNNHDISWTLWTYKVTGNGTNSWGLYNLPIDKADLENDTFDEIKEKWSKCNTANAVENKEIKPIVEKFISYYPNQIMINGAKVGNIVNQIYTGKQIKPNVNINFNGSILNKDTDYTVRYSNNIQCGVATATITGAGKYDGIIKVNFNIVPDKVKLQSKKIVSKRKSICLSWKKNNNADGYYIYQYKSGKYKLIKILKSGYTKYNVKGLKAGTVYKFKIVAYKIINGQKLSGQSNVIKWSTKAKEPKISIKVENGRAIIRWKKIKGATGYIIQRGQSKNGKYKIIKKVNKRNTKYLYKPKKKETIFIKITAYIKVNKKVIYGSNSKTKKIEFK